MAMWTYSEEILSLYLYLSSGRKVASRTSSLTKKISEFSGKSADSIILKTANFRSLDPLSKSKGMENVSRLDGLVWSIYGNNYPELEKMTLSIMKEPDTIDEERRMGPVENPTNYNIPDYTSEVKRRVGQERVRGITLFNYENKCCMCGIDHPDLLRASHIIPWSKRKDIRGDPKNILCLCSLHDSLFDSGLITMRDDYTLMLSDELKKFPMTLSFVSNLELKRVRPPLNRTAMPSLEYVAYHRNNIYRRVPEANNMPS